MSEEDLMFYAAKAAGHHRLKLFQDGWYVSNDMHGEDWHLWQPLTDDGDALRLAVKLGLQVSAPSEKYPSAYAQEWHGMGPSARFTEAGDDPYAATRRAIVGTAAAIGRAAATERGK